MTSSSVITVRRLFTETKMSIDNKIPSELNLTSIVRSREAIRYDIPDSLATLDLTKGPDVPVMTAMDRATTPTP